MDSMICMCVCVCLFVNLYVADLEMPPVANTVANG